MTIFLADFGGGWAGFGPIFSLRPLEAGEIDFFRFFFDKSVGGTYL